MTIPEGYALVPIEPTEAMLQAAEDNCGPVGCCSLERRHVAEIYRELIASAPPVIRETGRQNEITDADLYIECP